MSNKPKTQTQQKQTSQPHNNQEAGERIQKVLARGGLGSRREIERWIDEGRLVINGVKVILGQSLKEGDLLHINGRVVNWEKFSQQATRVLVYHKPTGEVVTRRDPEGRPVIFTQLPKLPVGRWIAVGRLDINTSGLIMVTNNGELANRLMHPSSEIEREYAVRILGEVNEEMMTRLKAGVELEDGEAHFDDVKFFAGEGANKWYHVVVKEGRNRLVRRLWESQEVTVSRLMRVRYGPAVLPERVKSHSYYELDAKELAILMEFVDMPAEKPQLPHWQQKKSFEKPKANTHPKKTRPQQHKSKTSNETTKPRNPQQKINRTRK
ncbi:MAG: pseudouridine synthase [Methylococcaceae bacterium]|nr:pseudouridine synthase [Methylococcaceae bacterium]